MKVAVAAFVKTPGLSPIKTRLAAAIGAAASADFYRRSVAAVEALLVDVAARGFSPLWAVAEADGLAAWPSAPIVAQGEGGLATRLAHVEATLFAQYEAVFFIGADCPQLAVEDLEAARDALEGGASFVLGPAADGGFFLYGARIALGEGAWKRVPMSASDTAVRLAFELTARGAVAWLDEKTDGDLADDLPRLAMELATLARPSVAQRDLLGWLTRFRGDEPPSKLGAD